MHGKNFF